MNVAVFGATGGTGRELVKQALERGHAVTAFVRDGAPLAGAGDGLTVMTGDIHDVAAVERCVQGQDAVLCALGSRHLKKTMIHATCTATIIDGMKRTGVKRLIVVSAMGVGERCGDRGVPAGGVRRGGGDEGRAGWCAWLTAGVFLASLRRHTAAVRRPSR